MKTTPIVAPLLLAAVTAMAVWTGSSFGQDSPPPASQPANRVATPLPADQMLNQMLRPSNQAPRPLRPLPEADVRDATSGGGAVSPAAPSIGLLREGTFIVDRTGRLTRTADGLTYQFTFDSDGRALRDPPMVILPNLKLQTMEDAVKSASRDLRFRVTGVVTEYRGRNAILFEKVVVIPDVVQGN